MYGKIFDQIFDSSIANDYKLRHFFMDLIVLADVNGVVDMTQEAISHRTRIPLREVKIYLNMLQEPDTRSRTPDHDGRRIKLLDEHRDWGWLVVNYDAFRRIADEETRRSKTKDRVAKFRNNIRAGARASTGEHGRARASTGEHGRARRSTTEHDGARRSTENTTADNQHVAKAGNPPVTPCNAGNAMQKQKQKQKQREEDREGAEAPGGVEESTAGPEAASKSQPKPLPAEAQAWNAKSGTGTRKVLAMSPGRVKALRARHADPFFTAHWQSALDRIAKSDFCTGKNGRGWRADFDFFLRPDTVAKAMEGNYDNRNSNPQPQRREFNPNSNL